MTRYNRSFDLSIDDLEMIETALRSNKQALSTELMAKADDPLRPCAKMRDIDMSLKQISDLLGRLHNQKTFFRPQGNSYISG